MAALIRDVFKATSIDKDGKKNYSGFLFKK
jgi:hypothetical protein